MIKLKKIEILKYKSFIEKQDIDIEDDITVLVGMNESGKTSVLECLAKVNYFVDDKTFKFNKTFDYPRNELKAVNKQDASPKAILCKYILSENILETINNTVCEGCWAGTNEITILTDYNNHKIISGVNVDIEAVFKNFGLENIDEEEKKIFLSNVHSLEHFEQFVKDYPNSAEDVEVLRGFFRKDSSWENFLEEYIYFEIIQKNLPKFIYYDEYYQLPSKIILENFLSTEDELSDELKTAKALLELAEIDPNEIITQDDFESYIADLEATEAAISDTLFEYWSANKNLNIEFKIDKKIETKQVRSQYYNEVMDSKIVEHVLDIRVKNSKNRVSLPLQNRSKGFNWFFSFLVWFKKIQADKESTYILLLDEPGLNLHANAQKDLLNFLESLTANYQIIYTTHSPFMVETTKLNRVRTVFSGEKSSMVSESIQQKDPNTLFPLQAALGYDIAQNLFISNKNLLVEGVSDLLYLTILSEYLNSKGRIGLKNNITIVPTGGLEKVASFISLLRGSELSIFCLLDSFTDQKAQAKFDSLTTQKIIAAKNIRFFHNYLENRKKADIEDMFTLDDYLLLFNSAFEGKYRKISSDMLDTNLEGILAKINKTIEQPRFNHYSPAKTLMSNQGFLEELSETTLSKFEKIFEDINKNLK